MANRKMITEHELAALAKQWRMKSGLSKAEMAKKLGVSRPSMQQAEENPEQHLTKLRIRIIEACSPYRVRGPAFWLERR